MAAPVAFISYSHDSVDHKKWVLELGTKLRAAGVDALLDQWELGPGSDLAVFMERNLSKAGRVLMVCTEKYVAKANAGVGGVGYEKMIVTADLMKNIDSNKVIPLIRQAGTHEVPAFLKTKIFLDFSRQDQFEFSFDELVRSLHNAPLFKKPPIGSAPYASLSEPPPVERTGDSLVRLMAIVTPIYEAGHDFFDYRTMLQAWGGSRIFFDGTIDEARAAGLVTQDSDGDLRLTRKGQQFIVQHKLYRGA